MKWFWLSLFEEHWSFGPILCLFLTALWCVQSPHSSTGKSALLQPVRNNQRSLPTTQLYILPIYLQCLACGIVYSPVWWVCCWSLFSLWDKLRSDVVSLKPPDLAVNWATVKSRKVLLSSSCSGVEHWNNYFPLRHKHIWHIAILPEAHDDHNWARVRGKVHSKNWV